MTRIAALILSLVMLAALFPAGVAVTAEGVEKEPFYYVNISKFENENPYVYYMPQFYCNKVLPMVGDLPKVSWQGVYDIPALAELLKEDFNNRPDGTRYINFTLMQVSFRATVENSIYMDKGVELTSRWLNVFLAEYKRIGGKLDGLIVDLEYNYVLSWYIKNHYEGISGMELNKNIYNDIVNDPRYATQIRPRLEEWGFDFYDNVGGEKSEIFSIYPRLKEPELSKYAESRSVWDAVMRNYLSECITESTYEPLIRYYPDGIVSDYQRPDLDIWQKAMSDTGGIRSSSTKGGNASNFNTYSNRISDSYYTDGKGNYSYNNPPSYNKAVFGSEPFRMTQWDTNLFKNIYAATDTGIINAWTAGHKWSEGNVCTTSNTPYYAETLFHMCMLDLQPLIGYVTTGYEGEYFEEAGEVISDIMVELTKVAGYADRKPIQTPATWNGEFVLSGMYAGGRNIWRFTPNTEVKFLKNVLVDSKTPTFSIDGQTITFPQGKIIADGNVRVVGTSGYWIETPADVMPVITGGANRYQAYPSFAEDFEKYEANSVFASDTALPISRWQVTGDMTVQARGGSKVLAMTGSATATNVKLPQNITAGDGYAKQQAWEVKVTLPEGLPSNAVLKLLRFGEADDGIKISDGKAYGTGAGGYQEMPGVSLSAGTYTLKREFDFRTEGAFTCGYYIYDDAGKLLSQLQDVAIASTELPITSIGLSCTNVKGTVCLDDYKLYPTGVTTDFEVYDVKFGKKLTVGDTTTADTAYRLSWMNASAESKISYIYNELDGKILKKGRYGVGTGRCGN